MVDPHNYKGIYIDEEPGTKFQDPETGAHFDYQEMFDKLLEVETTIRRSQERDPKTIEKNKELLKDEDKEGKQVKIDNLFKTEDHTRVKVDKRIGEVFSMCPEYAGISYDSTKFVSSKANDKVPLNIVRTMNNPIIKIEGQKNFQMSAKKKAPKKVSELIYLKKKPSGKSKNSKQSNINIILGNKERDLKKLFKNSNAKSKYQKYLFKQVKTKKLAYPTISDTKSTRNAFPYHDSQDQKFSKLLKSPGYQDSGKNMKKEQRKSSRSNTSRKHTDVHAKKSVSKLDKMVEKPFLDHHYINDRLYTIKTHDLGAHKIFMDGSQERRKVDSIFNSQNRQSFATDKKR